MSVQVNKIIADAAEIIQDQSYARFSQADWLNYLDNAQQTVLIYRPDAYCGPSVETLVDGYRQVASAQVRKVMKVVSNIDGPAITVFDKKELDLFDPEWINSEKKSIIKNFDWNADEPKTFYVYPPAKAGIKVEISASLYPAKPVLGGVFLLPDEFSETCKFYMLYQAYLIESPDYDMSKANSFFNIFLSEIGAEKTSRISGSPTSSVTAGEPVSNAK